MSRLYSVSFAGVAVTAQQDFFELVAAAGRPIRPLAIYLSQSSEVGDAAEEGLSILIRSGQTTSGSGGSAPTPVPACFTDAAAGFSAETNNTTKASAGTIVTHHADNWIIRQPFQLILPDRLQQEIAGSRRWTVELATTPADSITISGTVYVEEIG
jgi:hypothetical protein